MIKFKKPTLITLTSPTCGGKTWLMDHLIKDWDLKRVVGTTDRPARAGEIEGVHYHFITTEESMKLEADDKFAEIITYNGVRYGVTHAEMQAKVAVVDEPPPIIILEPSGLSEYKRYCVSHGWDMMSVFVYTPEAVRLKRLAHRTTDDIVATDGLSYEAILNLVVANNKRLTAIFEHERSWFDTHKWDVVVPGTSLDDAKSLIISAANVLNDTQ